MRAATMAGNGAAVVLWYFNPRCPCGQRHTRGCNEEYAKLISIHAAHAGSDNNDAAGCRKPHHFNPRCPCGQRHFKDFIENILSDFNPRCPCGQRQADVDLRIGALFYFNPRCPCGQRQEIEMLDDLLVNISIHAAHAGSDAMTLTGVPAHNLFQSTLPMRAATKTILFYPFCKKDFNPRCPCGQRHELVKKI